MCDVRSSKYANEKEVLLKKKEPRHGSGSVLDLRVPHATCAAQNDRLGRPCDATRRGPGIEHEATRV